MVVGQKLCCSARLVVGFIACLFFDERGGGVRGEEKDEESPIPFMKSLLGASPPPPTPTPPGPSGRIRSLAHNAKKSSGVVQNKVD